MKRRVALLIETSSIYGRGVLSGIVRFMRMHDDWSVFLEQRDLTRQPPSWITKWKGDGIISRATTPKLLSAVRSTKVPIVELTDRYHDSQLISVRSDDFAIGEMAATHLLERGFRRFGFCGFKNEAWSDRREQAFVGAVSKHGFPCDVYNSVWHGAGSLSWEDEQRKAIDWLSKMPKPLGVMACNDLRGQSIVDACSQIGYAVPEQVAIIGVDNDELLCRVCDPPLSSVMANAEGVGYRAAELLATMMDGNTPEQQHHLVIPLGVATRQSTDAIAIDDPDVVIALRYIRQHACRGISVEDLVDAIAISRSSLERKLRQYLGRTPQQEIRNVQVKRACELLLTTNLSTEQIAPLCGFSHPEYMYVVFKRILGITPGDYRQSSAGSG